MNTQELILALFGAVIVPLLPVLRAYVLTKLTPTRLKYLDDRAKMAVTAAEKLADFVPGTTNEEKLTYASKVVVDGAKRVGIRLTEDEILAFVHAALVAEQGR